MAHSLEPQQTYCPACGSSSCNHPVDKLVEKDFRDYLTWWSDITYSYLEKKDRCIFIDDKPYPTWPRINNWTVVRKRIPSNQLIPFVEMPRLRLPITICKSGYILDRDGKKTRKKVKESHDLMWVYIHKDSVIPLGYFHEGNFVPDSRWNVRELGRKLLPTFDRSFLDEYGDLCVGSQYIPCKGFNFIKRMSFKVSP